MFGTNDLSQVPLAEYESKTRDVVQRCLDNGTVVILSTIPPRSGMLQTSRTFADIVRKIGHEMKLPVEDYFADILGRRPGDWDGAAEIFRSVLGDEYQVPTLISRDGIHPSHPSRYDGDYSVEGLRTSGYVLRNYVTLRAYAEVVRDVLGQVGESVNCRAR